jgi:hypothetical protein
MRRRVTVTVDSETVDAAEAAVASRQAPSLSARRAGGDQDHVAPDTGCLDAGRFRTGYLRRI